MSKFEVDTSQYLYQQDRPIADYATRIDKNLSKHLRKQVKRIAKHQEVLFADASQSVLFIFQGMDCAGKDSTIKHVLSGVNPQGVHVANFRQPTENELAHAYLWRYWRQMPRRGQIGIFNRSHYEEVLVMRVHPEYFASRPVPIEDINDEFWQTRMQDISAMEQHLHRNGIKVVKFFLNLSKDEQKQRLLGRIDRPHKNWKFDPRDMQERAIWDEYQDAFEDAIRHTHSIDQPWYIIPADDKLTMRALVANIMADTLKQLDINYPVASEDVSATLAAAKAQLLNED